MNDKRNLNPKKLFSILLKFKKSKSKGGNHETFNLYAFIYRTDFYLHQLFRYRSN